MEESIAYLKEQFQLPDQDIRTYSPLALAYIGDGIYELISGRLWWDGETVRPASCITRPAGW